jgi:hypothetical protein
MGALDRLITGAGALPPRQPPARDRHAWQREICNSGLPAVCRLAGLAISVYTNDAATQGVWLSSSDLANLTGVKTLTTVNTHVRTLVGLGWLHRHDGAWFLSWPGELPLAAAAATPPRTPQEAAQC